MINLNKGVSKSLIRELTFQLANQSKMLINLRLSKINLNDNSYEGGIVVSICELVKNSDTLSYLDLSWTSLSPS